MKISLRIIALLLSMLLALSIVACNKPEPIIEEATETEEITEAPATERSTVRVEDAKVDPVLQKVPDIDLPDGIKNIILIIGDGMGPVHLNAGQIYDGKTYAFTEWNHTVADTDSISSQGKDSATDSAAAATAIATGTLTNNGYVGKSRTGYDYCTILDVAKSVGKSTGIVTSDYLYGATPAGFSAHSVNRDSQTRIVETQLDSGVDFMLGLRDDGKYSRRAVTEKGYLYDTAITDTDKILAAEKALLSVNIENGKENEIALKDAASLAIDFLERDSDGFVLMIEQAYIDKYSHNNKIEGMLDRVSSLNQTVEMVMEWVGDRTDTAVIVTADHETGGLSISTEEEYENVYEDGAEKIYYQWASGNHTKTMVDVFVYGVDFEFSIISEFETSEKIKNTDIFKFMYCLIAEPQ